MSWFIHKEDIAYISAGAKFLSSGGGGDTKIVAYLLLSAMEEDDVIEVKTAVEMADEWVVPVAAAGSTVLMKEDLPAGEEIVKALKEYESVSGRKADAVISMEIGGINALTPLLAAFKCHLPVIDGDGMGRSFPELEMVHFYHAGIPAVPLAACSKDETLVINEAKHVSRTLKEFMFQQDGYCHFACFGAAGSRMRAAMVPGTLKLALEIGKILAQNASIWVKVQQLRHAFFQSVYGEMEIAFAGKIRAINRWFEEEMLVGALELAGQMEYHKQRAKLYFQNEFLSFQIPDACHCTTPDLIIFVHYETGLPVAVSELREGMMAMVLTVKAPGLYQTKKMLAQTGPEMFRIPNQFLQKETAGRRQQGENWH